MASYGERHGSILDRSLSESVFKFNRIVGCLFYFTQISTNDIKSEACDIVMMADFRNNLVFAISFRT
jgi:hypothetical protein